MKFSIVICVVLAVLPFAVLSNEVVKSQAVAPPSVENMLQIINLKMDELILEGRRQIEQLRYELYQLRQSVGDLTWVTSHVERIVREVQLDTDVLVKNVSQLTSQTDVIILNQQYCANHEALKNLFFNLTPKCLGDDGTTLPPLIPSTTTTESSITSTTESTTITTESSTTSTTESTSTEEPTTTEEATTTEDPSTFVYQRCSDAPMQSGVYNLRRRDGTVFRAFCEQIGHDGGWLVFQKRVDGSVNFNRTWAEYVNGFGDPSRDYWLGLETLHQITAGNATDLVIHMKNYSYHDAYESYVDFWIESWGNDYRLKLAKLGTGTAGDSLYRNFNARFMTYDRITNSADHGCTSELASGFWHTSCNSNIRNRNNLNGVYGLGKYTKGIWWGTWGGGASQNRSPLMMVLMMIRN